jgi:hypothetical protein
MFEVLLGWMDIIFGIFYTVSAPWKQFCILHKSVRRPDKKKDKNFTLIDSI